METRHKFRSFFIIVLVVDFIDITYGRIFLALPVRDRYVMLVLLLVASEIVVVISIKYFAEERYRDFAARITLASFLLFRFLTYLGIIDRSDDVLHWPEDALIIIGVTIIYCVFLFAFWLYGFKQKHCACTADKRTPRERPSLMERVPLVGYLHGPVCDNCRRIISRTLDGPTEANEQRSWPCAFMWD